MAELLDPTSDDILTILGINSPAEGDILYGNASSGYSKLPKGSDGEVLTLAAGIPSWAAGGGGAFLPLAGGTMSGDILMGDNDIFNIKTLGVGVGSVTSPYIVEIYQDSTTDQEAIYIKSDMLTANTPQAYITFNGIINVGGTRQDLAQIQLAKQNNIDDDERGQILFFTAANVSGALTQRGKFDGNGSFAIEGSLMMRAGQQISMDADFNTTIKAHATTDDLLHISTGGIIAMSWDANQDTVIENTKKLFLDGVDGVPGDTYIAQLTNNVVSIVSAGVSRATFSATAGVRSLSNGMMIDAGDKMILNGLTSSTSVRESSSGVIALETNGADSFLFTTGTADIRGANIINIGNLTDSSIGALRLGNASLIGWRDVGNTANLTFGVNASDNFEFVGGDVDINAASLAVDATEFIYLNGIGGSTSISEIVNNTMDFVTNSASRLRIHNNGAIAMLTNRQFNIDGLGGAGDTFFIEDVDDNFLLNVGGEQGLRLAEIGTEVNAVFGAANALLTTATDGFIYFPSMAGTPTGNSTDYTGKFPIVFDSSANKLWVNTTGTTWVDLTGAGGGISAVVDDTTPQLGGNLDANGFDIQLDETNLIDFDAGSGATIYQANTAFKQLHIDIGTDSVSNILYLNGPHFIIESPEAHTTDPLDIVLYRSKNPGDDGAGAHIRFRNRDSAGTVFDSASLNGGMVDATAGSVDGLFDFSVYSAGTSNLCLTIDGRTKEIFAGQTTGTWNLGRASGTGRWKDVIATGLDITLTGVQDGIAKFGDVDAADASAIWVRGGAKVMKLFSAGGGNQFVTGSIAGDSGITFGASQTWWLGEQGGAEMMKVDNTNIFMLGNVVKLDTAGDVTIDGATTNQFTLVTDNALIDNGLAHFTVNQLILENAANLAGQPYISLYSNITNGQAGKAQSIWFHDNNASNQKRGQLISGGLRGITAGAENGTLEFSVHVAGTHRTIGFSGTNQAWIPASNAKDIIDIGQIAGTDGELRWRDIFAKGLDISAVANNVKNTSQTATITINDDTANDGLIIKNTDGSIIINNATATANTFQPRITFNANSDQSTLFLNELVAAKDTASNPIINFNLRLDTPAAIATRPLFGINNHTTRVFELDKDGNLELGGGTVSATGVLQLANDKKISWRDNGDTADYSIWLGTGDKLTINTDMNFNGNNAENIGFFNLNDATILTIATAVITSTQSYHTIAAESGTSDTLSTINGGTAGDIMILRADTGDTITIDEAGNILLTTASVVLNDVNDRLVLQYDGTNWVELAQALH